MHPAAWRRSEKEKKQRGPIWRWQCRAHSAKRAAECFRQGCGEGGDNDRVRGGGGGGVGARARAPVPLPLSAPKVAAHAAHPRLGAKTGHDRTPRHGRPRYGPPLSPQQRPPPLPPIPTAGRRGGRREPPPPRVGRRPTPQRAARRAEPLGGAPPTVVVDAHRRPDGAARLPRARTRRGDARHPVARRAAAIHAPSAEEGHFAGRQPRGGREVGAHVGNPAVVAEREQRGHADRQARPTAPAPRCDDARRRRRPRLALVDSGVGRVGPTRQCVRAASDRAGSVADDALRGCNDHGRGVRGKEGGQQL
ncbi:hypothetical protein BU14_0855s0006 [Porphyra umbilicalis]|uniref:Uncharacterized protein n=1 Tax=Porphyra umbilicalis TaxID=2786 RepID=A0A1X6NNV0_PORUM|nr:hypothetical protein BU14_0855s0006 [Porphyra umbilicalis]|eukprot:OSX70210.1 hypothetical protein BU14_0855s0006 [Porphyra umbilicalis]